MRRALIVITPVFDLVLAPFVLVCAMLMRLVRKLGVQRLSLCRHIFYGTGIFPIQDHYYEPLFNPRNLRFSLRQARKLPGLNMNAEVQLGVLSQFNYQDELSKIPLEATGKRQFYYHNGAFESGDADFLYNMIRAFKPARLYEIGSGQSTLMALQAIEQNRHENPPYTCDHLCVEPFEEAWLEQTGVQVVRKRVEELEDGFFSKLEAGDILFIDSSHIIRPQGDVLFEYLQLLPQLKPGVLIHVHDIFTPHDYPDFWILNQVKFYNEQYLLEAFLAHNSHFEVIGALNYLAHFHRGALSDKCPIYGQESSFREPGSFWLRKIK